MAGIGNYIHLTASGYLEHGISKNGRYRNYHSQVGNIRNKLKNNQVSNFKKIKEDLESVLNSMMHSSPNNFYAKKAQKIVLAELQKRFGETCGKINFDTGDVLFPDIDMDNVVGQLQPYDFKKNLEKINSLEKILEKKLGRDSSVLSDLQNLKNEYENIIKKIEEQFGEKGVPEKQRSSVSRKENLGQTREKINAMIEEYAAYPAINLQKGDTFEILLSLAPMVAKQTAAIEVGEVIGREAEQVSFNLKNFDNKFLTQEFKNGLIKTAASQGKIDVQINWEGEKLGISAKNVNLNNNYVTLVSGTNLLYLLQDEDTSYVNHLLNILASHSISSEMSQKEKNNEENKIATIQGMRPAAIRELRLILFYKALTGAINGRKPANLFIVNDSSVSGGGVYVHSALDLFNKIAKNRTSLIGGDGLGIEGINKDFYLSNNKASSSAERISALLSDAHAKKITVKIYTGNLK